MTKSRDAFRTISEVSTALDTPAHVLRFWESKFSQVKPVKRAGGRRYYRPNDVELLAGIKKLLHTDGMTIKGAQKLLREKGVKSVAAIGAEILNGPTGDVIEGTAETTAPVAKAPEPAAERKPVPKPEPDAAPETKSEDVAPVPEAAPAPDLTINLEPKPESQPVAEAEPAVTKDPTPKPAWRDIPADPADSASKAPARIFHLIQKAAPDRLATKAEQIAPLLDRMQVLRDRISTR